MFSMNIRIEWKKLCWTHIPEIGFSPTPIHSWTGPKGAKITPVFMYFCIFYPPPTKTAPVYQPRTVLYNMGGMAHVQSTFCPGWRPQFTCWLKLLAIRYLHLSPGVNPWDRCASDNVIFISMIFSHELFPQVTLLCSTTHPWEWCRWVAEWRLKWRFGLGTV